jgi:hypothetical protein
LTVAASPVTVAEPPLPVATIESGPSVPVHDRLRGSGAGRGPAQRGSEVVGDCRDGCAGQVIVRQRVVFADRRDIYLLELGEVHGDGADVARDRACEPFAARRNSSAAAEPLNAIASWQSPPPIMSLPSPGSQDEAVIARTEDHPVGATVSVHDVVALATVERFGPLPPSSVSSPPWPSICVRVVVVNAPFDSSIRTWSLPLPTSTTIQASRSCQPAARRRAGAC